jgi:hypothetical protein
MPPRSIGRLENACTASSGRAGHGKDICYIKPDKDFIAFGFGEVVNPTREEGANMHPVAWTLTSLDAATEEKIRALVQKAVG